MDISFIFSGIVNKLGSLIHTSSKSNQLLSASSEAPAEGIGKIIFSVRVDWHVTIGLFGTMHYWTEMLNKNTGIGAVKALYNET